MNMKIISYSELLDKNENLPMTYQELLSTSEWRNKRDQIIERDFKRCTKCHYSETFGHLDSKTNKYSYITDDGEEDTYTYTNHEGIIVTEKIPRLIITDKQYHLHVHHKHYVYNQLPWNYDNSVLITLCNWCHLEIHQTETIVMYQDGSLTTNVVLVPCKRCDGAGWFAHFKHVQGGICFECNGKRFTRSLIDALK
jgi:hypothetical protein